MHFFYFRDFLAQKCTFSGFFGSNFSNFDIFGRKNLFFSGFESAKICFFALFKVPKTFFEGHLFGNLVPLCNGDFCSCSMID